MATKWVKLFHKCIVLHCILSFLHLVVLEVLEEICTLVCLISVYVHAHVPGKNFHDT